MIEIRLPKPGPEIENATITRWEQAEGNKIEIGDILAIIKTPIGSFKVAAEEQGILEDVLQGEGESIDFNEPIALLRPDLTITDFPNIEEGEDDTIPLPIEAPGDENESEPTPVETTPEDEESKLELSLGNEQPEDSENNEELNKPEALTEMDEDEESTVDAPPAAEPVLRLADEDEFEAIATNQDPEAIEEIIDADAIEETETLHSPELTETVETEAVDSNETDKTEPEIAKPEISPAAKRLAERCGIDLNDVTGTGDNGKIHLYDVENTIQALEEKAAEPEASADENTEEIATESEASTDEITEEIVVEEPTIEPETNEDTNLDLSASEEAVEAIIPTLSTISTQPTSITKDPEETIQAEEPIETIESALTTDSGSFLVAEEEEEKEEATESDEIQEPETPQELDSSISKQEPSFELASDEPISNVDLEAPTEGHSLAEGALPGFHGSAIDYNEISDQFHISKKDDLIIPFNNHKKAFSEAQMESNRSVPHFYLFSEIDFTEGKKWLEAHNEANSTNITFTDLLVKITGQSLAMMPEMNAFVRNDRIILKRSVNIGITTTIEEGVVTPVVPDVYHKSLGKVSESIRKNVQLATETKMVVDYDTTFTVSVFNDLGIKRYIPLITPPQTGCIAVGDIQKKVVPVDDFIGIRHMIEVTLACDSRSVDATNAARFLQSIRESIESLRIGEEPDWICGNEQLRLI